MRAWAWGGFLRARCAWSALGSWWEIRRVAGVGAAQSGHGFRHSGERGSPVRGHALPREADRMAVGRPACPASTRRAEADCRRCRGRWENPPVRSVGTGARPALGASGIPSGLGRVGRPVFIPAPSHRAVHQPLTCPPPHLADHCHPARAAGRPPWQPRAQARHRPARHRRPGGDHRVRWKIFG